MKTPSLNAIHCLDTPSSASIPLPSAFLSPVGLALMASSGDISVGCGIVFEKSYFHKTAKPAILRYVREQEINYRSLGGNPDIKCKKRLLILEGQTKKGGKIDTDINFAEMVTALNLQTG